ncbi:Hypothetical predicted protein [Mytilus galloprovincialis]|uniref:Uncharacterized protein n=1 Tax=Mytilus galloprovincialis TaxID=29158 RepID=A0A8B6BHW9_MYTGA|nr:Hypothetical predicted protein [Mytilus galloprovincialis]
MDRSKESQSRPGSVQRNRIARKQEDAESTIPTGRLSPSLFPKEDRMDLSKQLQSRQESEHNKKLACKREDAENTILLDKMPEELLESSAQVEPIPSQSVANVERTLPKSIANHKNLQLESGLECGLELGDNRNYAKDETQMSVDLIKPFQDQALAWVPPPPPDPPNPP